MNKRFKSFNVVIVAICFLLASLLPITSFAASEDELRSAVVNTASAEVGYTGTSTYSKYGDWYGYQGGWCTTFVLWCFNQVGQANGVTLNGNIIPRGGNCNSMISWFKDKKRYYSPSKYTPKSGDLVFFDWTGSGSCDHVGIVNYTSGKTVYTVEGNCSGKVKAREYTEKGSKPYNNISAIMGYASPNYASASGSNAPATTKKPTTTKKATTKKVTTKKATAKKAITTKKVTAKAKQTTSKKAQSAKQTTSQTNASSQTNETTSTTAQPAKSEASTLTNLQIHASKYDLQVGDTVKLEYSVEPQNTNAVVGYFCDQEGIIKIGANGNITAIGNGTATVVVCANDDLYAQCDFVVTDAVGEVTTMENAESRKVVATHIEVSTTKPNAQSVLTRLGVNINALEQNKQLYIVPASIAGVTAFVSIFIAITKKFKHKK